VVIEQIALTQLITFKHALHISWMCFPFSKIHFLKISASTRGYPIINYVLILCFLQDSYMHRRRASIRRVAYWISSCGQHKRGGPPTSGLDRSLKYRPPLPPKEPACRYTGCMASGMGWAILVVFNVSLSEFLLSNFQPQNMPLHVRVIRCNINT
jgi:hypothetical protein